MRKNSLLLVLLAFAALGMRAQSSNSLRINEVMSANVDRILDPTWNYGGWIEIYNPTTRDINLKNHWFSDDPDKRKKLRIAHDVVVPAKGFANLWFGHYGLYWPTQMNMKLDCDGGIICLSSNTGWLIDSVEYPPAISRTSYARGTDAGEEWGYTATPTPAATNEGIKLTMHRLAAPEVTPESQIFSGAISITVDIPEGATLRYTMDGSTPSMENGRTSTTGKLSTSGTRVYRFALFQDGCLSSPVVTRSYIKRDKSFNIPVVSVVTDPDHLYDPTIGFLTKGTNGRRGKGTSEYCNWNHDWDRPVNFEMLDPQTGKSLINMEADMSRCGGHSKGFTPFSFKIKAGKEYEGQNYLDYQFFPDKPYLKHKALQFRCGGNDYLCRIKDAALQSIVRTSGIDVDLQDYAPVCHYINGEFMGTINMREPNNKHNVYANHGLDDDEIDMYEIECDSGYVQMCGTRDAWQRLKELSAKATDAATYEQIKNLLDIDECCNYMAVQLYLGNNDWPQNNLKCWRPIMENGKFRFIMFDLDFGFYNNNPFPAFTSRQWYTFCQLFDVPGVSHHTREVEIVPIFMNLLKNADFRRRFTDAFCIVAGSVFEPERCRKLVNRLVSTVEYMQTRESGYPGRNVSPRSSADEVINGLANRAPMLYGALQGFGSVGLSGSGQEVKLAADTDVARISVNGQTVTTGMFDGRLYPPVTLCAQAPASYRFVGWKTKNAINVGTGTTLIPSQSEWKYSDSGPVASNWRNRIYSDKSWKEGRAPLGYGSHFQISTTISYGSDANNKYSTYYFRKKFQIDEMPEKGDFVLNYTLDDGCVIYINGVEASRVHMATGAVSYSTYSATSVSTTAATGSIVLDKSYFKTGENLIAVEVHNTSATSSDILWDASLTCMDQVKVEAGGILSREEEMGLPYSTEKLELQACYEYVAEAITKPVVINEVSAGNSVFVNEYFDKNDWVELYNMTSEDIDLAGMYLSDELENPTKYRISAEGTETSTILPAHGTRIIWCDHQDTKSQLHAPFKLANGDGAAIILTAADESWGDTLVYCAHDGMQTVGRFPDGGNQYYRMYRPSIDATNTMNSYTVRYEMPEIKPGEGESAIDNLMATHSGGLSIRFQSGQLMVKSEYNSEVQLRVYTLDGRLAMSHNVHVEAGQARVSVTLLASGTYVARVSDNEGNDCAVKFVK
ncbi:MAG: CotH kinase family protein [Bacteroidaceae bacterium]|nr:CotH kinase family protein [Bacteroidaceae bacterium]